MIPKKSLETVLDKSVILTITAPNDNAKSISVQCAPPASNVVLVCILLYSPCYKIAQCSVSDMHNNGKKLNLHTNRFFLNLYIEKIVLRTLMLTDGILKTGAYRVPSKSQNPTILGQGSTHMFKP